MPIGAFYGKGKRTGVYGAYLLACYNADTEDYETICKIGTGFSDEQLKTFYDELSPHVIPGPKSYYQWEQIPKDTPDVWLDARTVWEVSAADLSISPVHKAAVGLVDDAKGIALRYTLPFTAYYACTAPLSHCTQVHPPVTAYYVCKAPLNHDEQACKWYLP